MRFRSEITGADKRLFSINEVCAYLGVGKNLARDYMNQIGAVVRIGNRVLYDKHIIDSEIDKMSAGAKMGV